MKTFKTFVESATGSGTYSGASAQEAGLPDPNTLLTNATSIAETALTAGIGLGVVVIGWRLVKRFLTRG